MNYDNGLGISKEEFKEVLDRYYSSVDGVFLNKVQDILKEYKLPYKTLSDRLVEISERTCNNCGKGIEVKYKPRGELSLDDRRKGVRKIEYKGVERRDGIICNSCLEKERKEILRNWENVRDKLIERNLNNKKDFFNLPMSNQLLIIKVFSIIKGNFSNTDRLSTNQYRLLDKAIDEELILPVNYTGDALKPTLFEFSYKDCIFAITQEVDKYFVSEWIRNNAEYYVEHTMLNRK